MDRLKLFNFWSRRGPSKRKAEAYLRYVEALSEARTKYAPKREQF